MSFKLGSLELKLQPKTIMLAYYTSGFVELRLVTLRTSYLYNSSSWVGSEKRIIKKLLGWSSALKASRELVDLDRQLWLSYIKQFCCHGRLVLVLEKNGLEFLAANKEALPHLYLLTMSLLIMPANHPAEGAQQSHWALHCCSIQWQ